MFGRREVESERCSFISRYSGYGFVVGFFVMFVWVGVVFLYIVVYSRVVVF